MSFKGLRRRVDLSPAAVAAGLAGRARANPADVVQRIALPLAWGVLIIPFSIMRPDTFPTVLNFSGIFGMQAVLVVLTLAILIPLTAGDYDLSAASALTLSSMTLALLNVNYHWPIGAAIVAAVVVGTGVGIVNGAIIVMFGIDPFIVTLGTGTFFAGITYWISASETISGISQSLVGPVYDSRFLSIPLGFYYGVALCAILFYVFEFTPSGRRLLFVGRGRSVSRLSGISVSRVRLAAFVACGTLAGCAGVLYAGTLGAADPSSGANFLLPAYAAAFLGATSILPGRFNPWGAIIAVYFLQTGITGLQQMGVENFVQQLFYGGALVLAVVLSQVAQRRESRGAGD